MRKIISNRARFVTLLLCAVATSNVSSKPTLSENRGNTNPTLGVSSHNEHFQQSDVPIQQQGSSTGASSASYSRRELAEKPNTVVTKPRRLKVPSKVFHLLSDYEQKRSGETKKVVSSSIVGLMQKSDEDEEMQSRRLKVSTSIYNWLVSNQNHLEDISELPQNFPSLDPAPNSDITKNENTNQNSMKPLYRCPIGNKTCQLQHMGL